MGCETIIICSTFASVSFQQSLEFLVIFEKAVKLNDSTVLNLTQIKPNYYRCLNSSILDEKTLDFFLVLQFCLVITTIHLLL